MLLTASSNSTGIRYSKRYVKDFRKELKWFRVTVKTIVATAMIYEVIGRAKTSRSEMTLYGVPVPVEIL